MIRQPSKHVTTRATIPVSIYVNNRNKKFHASSTGHVAAIVDRDVSVSFTLFEKINDTV
jgi:hypothetical protein